VVPNHLERQFDVQRPYEVWVTDITMVRTYEDWLYVAVVLDLFSRQVIGWSMQSRMEADLVVRALLMAVWRRQPKSGVLVHSDQGSRYIGYDWPDFLQSHNLVSSMSRRGNCHDTAVAESFFQLLKRERIKRRIYPDRKAARVDIFDYIEMFYNRQRKHGYNDMLSPVEYKKRYFMKLASVQRTRGDSKYQLTELIKLHYGKVSYSSCATWSACVDPGRIGWPCIVAICSQRYQCGRLAFISCQCNLERHHANCFGSRYPSSSIAFMANHHIVLVYHLFCLVFGFSNANQGY
jgi:hypothetical protein